MKSTFITGPNGRYRVKYYQERAKPHDFLAVYPGEKETDSRVFALATAQAGNAGSICGCSVPQAYLQNRCRRVDRSEVWPSLVRRAESTD